MKFKILTEAQKKNKYKIYYITRDNDSKDSQVISAYSEKQAVELLRKFNNNIYRITEVDCIEDHSKDDGEQLSLFETVNLTAKQKESVRIIAKRIYSANTYVFCSFGLLRSASKDNSSSFNSLVNQLSDESICEILNEDDLIIAAKNSDGKYEYMVLQ